MHKAIRQHLEENNPNAVKFDGLDAAIIGVGNQYTKPELLIYSARKIVECYMKQGMTYMEALEYYGHNCECLWAGEHTPIIINDLGADMPEVVTADDHPPTKQIRKEQHALTPRRNQCRDGTKKRKDLSRIPGRVRGTYHKRKPA